jgi:hypothetical protein
MGSLRDSFRQSDSYSTEEKKISAASFSIGWTVVGFGVGGAFVIAVWAWGVSKAAADVPGIGFFGFLGADLLVAAAAGAAGALFGFIFGIPRTLDPASRAAVATAGTLPDRLAASHAVMAANTNLERISDWLTTLLIGATLVQIKDIAHWVGSLGEHLIATGPAANDALIPIIVIFYFALSFLGVYLITRLYLTSAFQQTLGMLAGWRQRAPDLDQLKRKLQGAVNSGTADDLKAAMAQYGNWNFVDKERNDPELNAILARVLVKQIAGGMAADRRENIINDLKDAIAKAATNATIKGQLKTEIDSGQMKTGDPTLDTELSTALASVPS